jgi:hypothetical protein
MRKALVVNRAPLALVLGLAACSRSEATKPGSGGPISRSTTVYVIPSAPPQGPSPFDADAGISREAAAPSVAVSDLGRFRVTVPAGLVPHATTGGTLWDGRGASFAVLFYDGRPRGVDRSPLYTAARDHLNESAIDREVDITFDTRKARERIIHASSANGATLYRRNVIVLEGDRTYDVSVSCSDRARLDDAEAETFFQSFHILVD